MKKNTVPFTFRASCTQEHRGPLRNSDLTVWHLFSVGCQTLNLLFGGKSWCCSNKTREGSGVILPATQLCWCYSVCSINIMTRTQAQEQRSNNISCKTEEFSVCSSWNSLSWWAAAGGAELSDLRSFSLLSSEKDSGWLSYVWLSELLHHTVMGDVSKYFELLLWRTWAGSAVSLLSCWASSVTHRLFWEPTGTGTPQTGSRSSTPEWRWSWSTARWWRCWCLQTPPGPTTHSHQQRSRQCDCKYFTHLIRTNQRALVKKRL